MTTSAKLASVLQNRQCGVYHLDEAISRQQVEQLVQPTALKFIYIDGHKVADKVTIQEVFAGALDFPFVTNNWDGFFDWLTDMSWMPAPGYVVLYDDYHIFAQAEPDEFSIAYKCFQDSLLYQRYIFLLRGQYLPDSLPMAAKIDAFADI